MRGHEARNPDGTATAGAGSTGPETLATYGLIDAMTRRRSRRFALGDHLQGGTFSYKSEAAPVPLSVDEEAVLAFAGFGRDRARLRGASIPAVRGSRDRRWPDHDGHGRPDAVERGRGRHPDSVHHPRRRHVLDAPAAGHPCRGVRRARRPRPATPLHRDVRAQPDAIERSTHRDPTRAAVHAAIQQVVGERARRDVLRPRDRCDRALHDDPVRCARGGVRVLLPRRQGPVHARRPAWPGSGSPRAGTCTTTSTMVASARSTSSRRTCWRFAGSSRA